MTFAIKYAGTTKEKHNKKQKLKRLQTLGFNIKSKQGLFDLLIFVYYN